VITGVALVGLFVMITLFHLALRWPNVFGALFGLTVLILVGVVVLAG
jgi:hypothetical protein